MKEPSKEQKIFNYLIEGNSITQRIAIELFHHYRLAVVINRLRNAGISIETTMKSSQNGSTYAVYKLVRS